MSNKTAAGGIPAIWSTLKHAATRTGVFRSARALAAMNHQGGFDCPGCAWPEPEQKARFEFCENGAKTLMAITTKKVVDEQYFRAHDLKSLRDMSEYELSQSGRLCVPALRRAHSTHFEPISYEQVYEIAASAFSKLRHPNRAVFYTSGRASNEAAFLYQLFARILGTNNLCDCSNLCHESSGVALKKTVGFGKGTVQIEDFLAAEIIFLIGHNPSTNHPRMLSTLQEARARGAKIVVINPMVEPGLKRFRHPQKVLDVFGEATPLAEYYMQPRVGGDHALFHALAYLLCFDEKLSDSLNKSFIENHTSGYEHYRESLSKIELSALIEQSGLSHEEVLKLAALIASHNRIIYAWGMGITQTTYAVNTIEAVVNVALLRGHLGRAGAGLCPVRGHSNVQGNRTVGIYEKPDEKFLERLSAHFGFEAPREHGLDVVDSILAMQRGEVDIFMALGGNFLSAGPDTEYTKAALSKVDLAIIVATSLNQTPLHAGVDCLLLPCLTRVEKDVQRTLEQIVSVENSMSIVHASRGHFEPTRQGLPSEVRIIAEIARRTLPKPYDAQFGAFADDYSSIRDAMGEVIEDLADYNARLAKPGGFLLHNPVCHLCFNTETSKAQFGGVRLDAALAEAQPYDLLLTTIRSHDQFNTAIYGLNDRYRGVTGERRVVFMNLDDIKRLGLQEHQRVDLVSCLNSVERVAKNFVVRAYDIKSGCAASYFPETNVLVPIDSTAHESNTPTSKLIPITIRASMPLGDLG